MIERDYYDNGQLRHERSYREGQLYGIEKWWYKNGQIMYEEAWYQGQLHGIMKGWWKNGRLRYKEYWLYDYRVSEEEYRRHELIVKLGGL